VQILRPRSADLWMDKDMNPDDAITAMVSAVYLFHELAEFR
jgi:hypothetical protein